MENVCAGALAVCGSGLTFWCNSGFQLQGHDCGGGLWLAWREDVALVYETTSILTTTMIGLLWLLRYCGWTWGELAISLVLCAWFVELFIEILFFQSRGKSYPGSSLCPTVPLLKALECLPT